MTTTYKHKLAELADAYWKARHAGDTDEARALWNQMDTIEPDPAPIPELDRWCWSNCLPERYPSDWIEGTTLHTTASGYGWQAIDVWLDKTDLDVTFIESACNGFRAVWLLQGSTSGAKAILTYCEGDLDCQVVPADAPESTWNEAVRRMIAFYNERT